MSTEYSLKEITDFNAVALVERVRAALATSPLLETELTTEAVKANVLRFENRGLALVAILVPHSKYGLSVFGDWFDPTSRYATVSTGLRGTLFGAPVLSDSAEDPWIEKPVLVGWLNTARINRPLYPAEPQHVSPHVQRMLIEFKELSTKLNALHEFVTANPLYPALSERERRLMCIQFEQMDAYATTLARRIALF